MARTPFEKRGTSQSSLSYWQNESPPEVIVDPSTGQITGWKPGTGRFITSSSNTEVVLNRGYRVSVSTPGFLGPKRPSILKPLNFQFVLTKGSSTGFLVQKSTPLSPADGPGSPGFQDYTSRYQNVLQGGFISVDTSAIKSRLRAKAITKMLLDLKGQSVNIAQAVAEREQTVKLFTSAAKSVVGCVSSLRRGNFAGAAYALGVQPPKRAHRQFRKMFPVDQTKAIANGWLALQFGVKPLLSDVYGSVEQLAKSSANGDNPNTIIGMATGKSNETISESDRIDHALQSYIEGDLYTSRSTDGRIAYRCGCLFTRSSPAVANLKEIGITNPLSIAWELTPWSFVIDWFLPIGNFISTLDATLGLSFESGYVTSYEKYHQTVSKVTSYRYKNRSFYANGRDFEVSDVVIVSREVLSAFPNPQLPSFKNPVSFSHLASAMALLRQLKG